jgi:hypothetical protein
MFMQYKGFVAERVFLLDIKRCCKPLINEDDKETERQPKGNQSPDQPISKPSPNPICIEQFPSDELDEISMMCELCSLQFCLCGLFFTATRLRNLIAIHYNTGKVPLSWYRRKEIAYSKRD